jgi:hypothetical protein
VLHREEQEKTSMGMSFRGALGFEFWKTVRSSEEKVLRFFHIFVLNSSGFFGILLFKLIFSQTNLKRNISLHPRLLSWFIENLQPNSSNFQQEKPSRQVKKATDTSCQVQIAED